MPTLTQPAKCLFRWPEEAVAEERREIAGPRSFCWAWSFVSGGIEIRAVYSLSTGSGLCSQAVLCVNCGSLDLCAVWCLFNNLPTPDSLDGPEQERKEMVVPRVIHVGASCPRNIGGKATLLWSFLGRRKGREVVCRISLTPSGQLSGRKEALWKTYSLFLQNNVTLRSRKHLEKVQKWKALLCEVQTQRVRKRCFYKKA